MAPVRSHDLRTGVDLSRPGLEVDLEALFRVILDRPHQHLLLPDLAAQEAGEGDAVVKRVPLCRDHDDRALWVPRAKLLAAGLPGDAVAEDHVAPAHVKPSSLGGYRSSAYMYACPSSSARS